MREKSREDCSGDLLSDQTVSVVIFQVCRPVRGQLRLAESALLDDWVFQQLLQALWVIGLNKVSVVFKNQFDLPVGQGAHFDVLLDPLRNGGFAQPGQILDDVIGLKAN